MSLLLSVLLSRARFTGGAVGCGTETTGRGLLLRQMPVALPTPRHRHIEPTWESLRDSALVREDVDQVDVDVVRGDGRKEVEAIRLDTSATRNRITHRPATRRRPACIIGR
jgi:hypothetical protein